MMRFPPPNIVSGTNSTGKRQSQNLFSFRAKTVVLGSSCVNLIHRRLELQLRGGRNRLGVGYLTAEIPVKRQSQLVVRQGVFHGSRKDQPVHLAPQWRRSDYLICTCRPFTNSNTDRPSFSTFGSANKPGKSQQWVGSILHGGCRRSAPSGRPESATEQAGHPRVSPGRLCGAGSAWP
jgi:hypothetical protein